MAKNLAGKNAGVRIDIPFNLRKSHSVLKNLAFSLIKCYPMMKRNIRFIDEKNFCLSRENWRTVKPHEDWESLKRRRKKL